MVGIQDGKVGECIKTYIVSNIEVVLKPLLTIVVHSDDLPRTFSFHAFHIAIDHFFHGYGVVTGEIRFIFLDGIFNQA